MSAAEIDDAAAILRVGGTVAFPTETVYGLGADATNSGAIARLFRIKGRPPDHPLIVHLSSSDELDAWASDVPDAARVLVDAFWPGALTIVVSKPAQVDPLVTGGRDTVALRVPNHPVALALLRKFGGGVAAPSANRFGAVSPTTAAHVIADLDGDVDMVLDGGTCAIGIESTIVELVDEPVILRPGAVPAEELEQVLGRRIRPAIGPSRAPGMMVSHYAPRCRIEIVEPQDRERRVEQLRAQGRRVDFLDARSDPESVARHLYEDLRRADERGLDILVAVLPDELGFGTAVADRLRKAAAPRPA